MVLNARQQRNLAEQKFRNFTKKDNPYNRLNLLIQ